MKAQTKSFSDSAEKTIETRIGTLTFESGDPVSRENKAKFNFSSGRVIKVVYEIAKEGGYEDVQLAMAAKMARDS
jgi:arylsulfatase